MRKLSITLALLAIGALVQEWERAREARILWQWVHPVSVQAGHPNKCNDGQGPPCAMASCAALDKNGNLTGVYCAPKKCTRTCCFCPTKCNGHPHNPPPDEEGGSPQ